VAQGEFAELVDGVVADAEVCAGLAVGVGFGCGLVGVFGGGSAWVGRWCLMANRRGAAGDCAEPVKISSRIGYEWPTSCVNTPQPGVSRRGWPVHKTGFADQFEVLGAV